MLGHNISSVVPALMALRSDEKYFKKLAGIRTRATVQLYIDGRLIDQDTGELQFTDYGISGIPVFQVSRYASKALLQKKKVSVLLDLVPSMSNDDFWAEMSQTERTVRPPYG